MRKFSIGDRVVSKTGGPKATVRTVVVSTPDSIGTILTVDKHGTYALLFEADITLAKRSCRELVKDYIEISDDGLRGLTELRREMRAAIEDGRD